MAYQQRIAISSAFLDSSITCLVYGFGFATVTASAPALISELVPKDTVGTSMGFFDTIMDVGQTIGPVISGLILATSLQYTGLFFSLTFILLLSCSAFLLFGMGKASLNNGKSTGSFCSN